MNKTIKECTLCLFTESEPGIFFQNSNLCNICIQTNELKEIYGTGDEKGKIELQKIINKMRNDGEKLEYDCIIGVSGGTDSSFLVHKAVTEWGLRPLLAHYDNTWNTSTASQNIFRIISKLGLDLEVLVVNNHEVDDILRAFFFSGVPELDAATDLGYAYFLRKTAKKHKIKYILEAHSFMEEGITPLNNNYFDGKYIKDIHKKFGKIGMKSYPLMTFTRFLVSTILYRIKIVRPLWYINYSKKIAQGELATKYKWENYGGNHLENKITDFLHTIYLPKKFQMNTRRYFLSAQVRNGTISRELAASQTILYPANNQEIEEYFLKRLDIDLNTFNSIMNSRFHAWNEFKTYKIYFEKLAPLFYLLAKKNLVTMSFYLKYCIKKGNYDRNN